MATGSELTAGSWSVIERCRDDKRRILGEFVAAPGYQRGRLRARATAAVTEAMSAKR